MCKTPSLGSHVDVNAQEFEVQELSAGICWGARFDVRESSATPSALHV